MVTNAAIHLRFTNTHTAIRTRKYPMASGRRSHDTRTSKCSAATAQAESNKSTRAATQRPSVSMPRLQPRGFASFALSSLGLILLLISRGSK